MRIALALAGSPNWAFPKRGVPGTVRHVVQHVGGIEAHIEAAPLAEAEDAARRRIQAELHRAGDDVPPGIAPLAGKRVREGGGVEAVARKGGGERSTDVVRADRASHAGSGRHAAENNRRLRQTASHRQRGRRRSNPSPALPSSRSAEFHRWCPDRCCIERSD